MEKIAKRERTFEEKHKGSEYHALRKEQLQNIRKSLDKRASSTTDLTKLPAELMLRSKSVSIHDKLKILSMEDHKHAEPMRPVEIQPQIKPEL